MLGLEKNNFLRRGKGRNGIMNFMGDLGALQV